MEDPTMPFASTRRASRLIASTLLLMGCAAASAATTAVPADSATRYRQWIAEMKDSPRGPFVAIKWFCRDGRVLPPKDYACAKKGEGWQHGEWSARTLELRAAGYKVATILAGVDAKQAVAAADFPDTYAQLLVEKFLIAADGGWILRKAQFYRGAIQEEDEREAARGLLTAMAPDCACCRTARTRLRRRRCATWPPRSPMPIPPSRRCG